MWLSHFIFATESYISSRIFWITVFWIRSEINAEYTEIYHRQMRSSGWWLISNEIFAGFHLSLMWLPMLRVCIQWNGLITRTFTGLTRKCRAQIAIIPLACRLYYRWAARCVHCWRNIWHNWKNCKRFWNAYSMVTCAEHVTNYNYRIFDTANVTRKKNWSKRILSSKNEMDGHMHEEQHEVRMWN